MIYKKKEENEEKIEDLEELVNDLQKNKEETALNTKKKDREINLHQHNHLMI